MKYFKFLAIAVLLASYSIDASAKPARRDVRTVTQPDGSELRIKMVGDEFMHFILTEDGSLLHQDENGYYTFGTMAADGSVQSTGIKATNGSLPSEAINIRDIDIKKVAKLRNIEERQAQSVAGNLFEAKTRAPQSGYGLVSSTYPRLGSPKGLIILVQYSDVKFTLSNPADYFHDMINGENFTQYGGTGSALQYFKDQSAGQFVPSFDVLGPVTLPQKQSYYGENDAYGDDKNPHLMVVDAINILDSTTDFSVYDTDGDGYIDNVYVIYAGASEASGGSANTVWPHSWDIRAGGQNLRVDGKIVAHYACSNEWEPYYNRPDGVGTFIHEFSHVMGLPDLYHTSDMVYYTPCEYNVLDYGCYNNDSRTPCGYSAFERNAMSWFEPIVLEGEDTVTLENVNTGQFALIPTSKNTEFFLLENRQRVGWDRYLPGHGMLIWHIDYNQNIFSQNIVNNTESHQYVDIVEANNNPNGASPSVKAGWTFPGTSNVTSFTATTTPALKDWSGKAIDLPITEITEANGLISFNVKGGKSPLDTPQPSHEVYNDPAGNYFIASWEPIEGATDYFISVYASELGESGEVVNGFDNLALPEGWTASKGGYFATIGNYGQASPSFKFDSNGQTLTSPELPSDATSLSFWAQGQSTKNTTLTIQGLINGAWVDITEYTPLISKSEVVSYEMPAGVRQIRFKMNKNQGNVALDDVVITYGGDEVLPDYDQLSTGGETSVRVDKFKEGVKDYYYHVTATDGTYNSKKSEIVYVNIDQTTAIDSITDSGTDANETPAYYNLQGMKVTNPQSGSMLIEIKGNQTRKIIVK